MFAGNQCKNGWLLERVFTNWTSSQLPNKTVAKFNMNILHHTVSTKVQRMNIIQVEVFKPNTREDILYQSCDHQLENNFTLVFSIP